MTVVTTTVDGKPATATYALATIAEYASLKKQMTVTVDEAGANGAIQTAVAIIGAGGLAWVLAGFAGEAGAAEILNPPERPGDADNHCSDKLPQCSDCLGVDGICLAPDHVGCPCEEHFCPGPNDLTCEDEDCNGKNGEDLEPTEYP